MAVGEDGQQQGSLQGGSVMDDPSEATATSTTETYIDKESEDDKHGDGENHNNLVGRASVEKTEPTSAGRGHDGAIHASGISSEGGVDLHSSLSKVGGLASHKSDVGVGDIEKGEAPGPSQDDQSGESDPNVIGWDGDSDPANPYNWPTSKKAVNFAVVALLTFVTPLASSVFAPGVPQLMADFGSSSKELASFVVSVYVLGFAFGPLLMAPLSEIYGRTPVYHVSNIGFVAFLVGCALAPSLESLVAFRFLSGVFGSCPLTNGGGSIADMVRQEKRGSAMSAFSVGPLIGPIVGPIAGGFLTAAKGWRWVFWMITIVAGCLAIAMAVLMRETYAPVILQRKVERLRKETGNELLRSAMDTGLTKAEFFKRGIIRPVRLLVRSPIVALFAIYITVVYGYLYIMFTSITQVFQEYYHFSTQASGLAFIGLGAGFLGGVCIFSVTSDRHLKKMAAKEGAGMKPEYRLHELPFGAILMPAGFFIYGWTAQYRVHWIVPILAHVLIGLGNMCIFMSQQL